MNDIISHSTIKCNITCVTQLHCWMWSCNVDVTDVYWVVILWSQFIIRCWILRLLRDFVIIHDWYQDWQSMQRVSQFYVVYCYWNQLEYVPSLFCIPNFTTFVLQIMFCVVTIAHQNEMWTNLWRNSEGTTERSGRCPGS